jgi:N-acetyl-anhydromuramyl-L-alanine amidase AmpD
VQEKVPASVTAGRLEFPTEGVVFELHLGNIDPPGSAPIPPVEDAQYDALVELLWSLIKAYGISPHRIVGHSDVRTGEGGDPFLLASDRQTCPGGMFEWTRLDSEGLGMIPKAGVQIGKSWGGYYDAYSEPLRRGDSDAKKVFGGKKRDDVAGVIQALQKDLLAIGYSVKLTGEFDEYTCQAVDRFKRHFFTGTRSGMAPHSLAVSDRIDKDTASMIVSVLQGLPKATVLPVTPAIPMPGTLPATSSPGLRPASGIVPAGGVPDAGTPHAMLSTDGDHVYALDPGYQDAPDSDEV